MTAQESNTATDRSFNARDFADEKPLDQSGLIIGLGKPLPPNLPEVEAYVVEFEGPDDRWLPYNRTSGKKLWISIIVCYDTFVATFGSAVFAPGSTQASDEFSVGTEVGLLGTSLFVLGFATGPMLFAPASEFLGRRWPLIVAMLGNAIFTVGSAAAKDIQTLIICRFFAGLCGASPLCVVPGVLSDLYTNVHRGVAISVYALTVFGGPLLAPFIGGFITLGIGWRWTLYITAIMGFLDAILLLIWLEETYHPIVLADKARIIRHQTGNWGIHARHEKIELDFQEVWRKYFSRPIRMLITEPIILAVTVYMSFIYGIVYALLEAYPVVFEGIHGMNIGVGALPFLGLFLGVICALVLILSQQGSYARKLKQNDNIPIPEWRLTPVLIGAFAFTIGLFWFAWTAFTPSIHWMAPTAAGVLIGFGVLCIFLPCFNYLVDAFLPIAASCVAANIILRSAVAAAFPLFSKQMFENLGVQWAGTLLGCLAAIMIPIPLVLKAFGPTLRGKSKMLAED